MTRSTHYHTHIYTLLYKWFCMMKNILYSRNFYILLYILLYMFLYIVFCNYGYNRCNLFLNPQSQSNRRDNYQSMCLNMKNHS